MRTLFTHWPLRAASRLPAGKRASVDAVRRFRIRDGFGVATGARRGDVVSMGILLKEGET